jgi:hypothetical protein
MAKLLRTVWTLACAGSLFVAAATPGAVVGYWRFEEGSGTTANDSSASNNDGFLVGNAAFLSSVAYPFVNEQPNVYSLSLDGTGDYVEIPDAASLDLAGPFTLEAFVRPTAADETLAGVVVKRNVIGNSPAYGLFFGSATGVRAAAQVTSPGSIATANTSLPMNQWSHVAAVWSGATLSLFVNAQFAGSVNGTGAVEVSAQPVRIGNYGADFAGQIDEVRISNAALQPEQFLYSNVFSDGFESGNYFDWSSWAP